MAKFEKLIFLLLMMVVPSSLFSQSVSDGENIFKQKCTACHTLGKGKLVGPDLMGVTGRREEAWLQKQIKTPDKMIAEKDPIALQLVKDMNGVPMAPLGLSDGEVASVISFLKSTSEQAVVATGLPSQYLPTLLISLFVLFVLTLAGLKAGRKNVDVKF